MKRGSRIYRGRSRHLQELVGNKVYVDYLDDSGILERDAYIGRLDYTRSAEKVISHTIQQGFYVGGHHLRIRTVRSIDSELKRIVVDGELC
jgi:hypothetical protein